MQLSTCRYQRYRLVMGAPIRTTVGPPRFELDYELAGEAHLLKPSYQMLTLGEEPYRLAYLARLDTAGVDAIRVELAAIAAVAISQRLVLLCFCDLSRPNAWCHRRMFADWWQLQTGEHVPELAEIPNPPLF